MIHKHMSIPEFINELDLYQLRMVEGMAKEKIKEITDQEKVMVWVFSSGGTITGITPSSESDTKYESDYIR